MTQHILDDISQGDVSDVIEGINQSDVKKIEELFTSLEHLKKNNSNISSDVLITELGKSKEVRFVKVSFYISIYNDNFDPIDEKNGSFILKFSKHSLLNWKVDELVLYKPIE